MHIDFATLALQVLNTLVLVWLLARFLFRPVSALLAERRAATTAALAEAERVRQQALADEADLARQRRDAAGNVDRLLTQARAVAAAETDALRQQAEVAATQLRQTAAAAAARERASLLQGLNFRAGDLAITIAQRLLQRLPSATVTLALFDSLASALSALGESERRRIADTDEPLEVLTASALEASEQQACRDRLAAVLGAAPKLQFSVDAGLIGGIELHGRQSLIRNSWRADLDQIRRQLLSEHEDELQPRNVA
jgi:F-type H+-transporting ATPase subunit b